MKTNKNLQINQDFSTIKLVAGNWLLAASCPKLYLGQE